MSGPGKKLNKKLLAYKFVKNFIAIKKWVFIIDNYGEVAKENCIHGYLQ